MRTISPAISNLHVLIGGGTGFVGRHLVKTLENLGVQVTVISRFENKSKKQMSWKTIDRVGLPTGVNSVVNLAGRNIFEPVLWSKSFSSDLYTSRIETNKKLVNAINAAQSKPESFVTMSGVGYYETDPNVTYNEQWVQTGNPTEFFPKLTRDWEAAGDVGDEKVRRVILRCGVVLGPDGGIISSLKYHFKFGLGATFGNGQQWFPWIHIDDIVAMIIWSINKKDVSGIINAVAPEIITNRQFSEALARSMNTKVRLQQPEELLKIFFGSDRASIILKGSKIESRARDLGYKFRFSTIQEATDDITRK